MKINEERAGVLSDYFGLDTRTLVTFFCLVVGVVIVVTGIYVAIFGFDNWKSSMSQAGSMMLSNFNDPNAATGRTIGPAGPVSPAVAPLAAPTGAQYSCPNCGAVGLPKWTQNGAPLCPNCGTVMNVTGKTGGQARLAAAP